MYMSEEASAFYLSRTLPFLSIAEIAKSLGVTRPTVDRMTDNWRIPVKYHDGFERLLDRLSNDFRKKAKAAPKPNFYEQLERAILDPEPRSAMTAHAATSNDEDFLDEVKPLLKRRVGMLSKDVLALGFKHGLNRQKVYRLTDELGVKRDVKGLGRNMVSTWYL